MTLGLEEKVENLNGTSEKRQCVKVECKKLKEEKYNKNIESHSKDVKLSSKRTIEPTFRTKDMTLLGEKVTVESKYVTPESKNFAENKDVKLGSKSVLFGTKKVIAESKKQTSEYKFKKPENKDMKMLSKNVSFGTEKVASESKKVPLVENKDLSSENKNVTVVESKELMSECKNLDSQDVKLYRKNVTIGDKDFTSEKMKVTVECKCVKSERKNMTIESKNVDKQSTSISQSKNRTLESIAQKRRNLSPDNLIWRRRSTGNFAAGSAGGGRDVPRSAPATPLQYEPTTSAPRNTKNEKQAVKPLSGSAISVRATGPINGTGDTKESKQPSKSRQKKFQRHFPQVGPEEKVLNYYSCALVGDLLLQGHLYITKNYFAFYSNVFGYVTKLLIPTISVLRITKEKVARIIPNAVGVCTRDERHVFGSLLSRDSTYKLMTHVWKAARAPETLPPKQDLRASEVELDASEYSPEDDSSSAGDRLDAPEPPVIRREAETLIGAAGASAILQPKLIVKPVQEPRSTHYQALLISIAVLLAISASWMCYKLYLTRHHPIQDDLSKLSGEELYSELVRFRARLHGRAANELHTFLSSNLLLLSKVRQSLEALSGVILTDMAREIPGDSVFS